MKPVELRGTGGARVGLYAFAGAWLCAVVLAMRITWWTQPATVADNSDNFFCWLMLAGGVLVSAAGFATTWAIALMDNRWACPPRGPARHSIS